MAALDALAFSSTVAAAVAAALLCAASHALGIPISPALVLLAGTGTIVVYNVDRLRDLDRDRSTSPARTAFIEQHAGRIRALVALSAVLAGGVALRLEARAWLLCGGALALGLLHRRLKGIPSLKSGYQALAWLAIVVGLPLVTAEPDGRPALELVAQVVGVLGLSLVANFIVSDLDPRAGSGGDPRPGEIEVDRRVRRTAFLLCALATGLAAFGSPSLPLLALVPAVEALAILFYRSDERYRLVVLDGALALGGAGSLLAP